MWRQFEPEVVLLAVGLKHPSAQSRWKPCSPRSTRRHRPPWDTSTGEELGVLGPVSDGPLGTRQLLSFSPAGQRLLSTGSDGKVM